MESTGPKPDNRGTADVGRRNGRNYLEMGSILFNRAVFLLGCWPWAGISPDGARLAKLFPWQSSGLHVMNLLKSPSLLAVPGADCSVSIIGPCAERGLHYST